MAKKHKNRWSVPFMIKYTQTEESHNVSSIRLIQMKYSDNIGREEELALSGPLVGAN